MFNIFSILGKEFNNVSPNGDEWAPDPCANPCNAQNCDCGESEEIYNDYMEGYENSRKKQLEAKFSK